MSLRSSVAVGLSWSALSLAACGSNAPTASSTGASSGATTGASTGSGSATGSASGSSSGTGGGTTGALVLHCPDGGFPGLSLTGAENDTLAESCLIRGDLTIDGDASLGVGAGLALTVIGNIALTGRGGLSIAGGVLGIGNLRNFERAIVATDDSTFSLTNAQLVTNPSGLDNLTSVVNASGRAKLVFDNATLDSNHNWLLASMTESSTLDATNSTTPNEIYLGDECAVNIAGSGTSEGVWLRLTSGSSGTLVLPNASTDFTWSAGSATGLGVGWNLTVTNAKPGLGIESHAGSTWTVIGADAGTKDATIGLYLDPSTPPSAPIALNDLPIGLVGATAPLALSFPWSAQPQLTLENVQLGPIAWQIYVGSAANGQAVPVTVTVADSVVNEVGVLAGEADLVNCTLQLAVLGALTPAAVIHATGDDIWCQTIEADNGGSIHLEGSSIHGSLFQASGGGQIQIDDTCLFAPSGNTPTCDFVTTYEHMLADNGRPSCSPFTNPMQLSTLDVADSTSSIEVVGPANQACAAITAGSYTPAIFVPQTQNPALAPGQGGSVNCVDSTTSAVVATDFAAYPVLLYDDATSLAHLTPDAGYDCTVTVDNVSNHFQITAPTCVF